MLWRLLAAAGGAGGLASLALPYALVTSGAVGLDLREEPHTLFELARLLADVGEDPQTIYLLVLAIAVGSTLALAGAAVSSLLAFVGGLLQGGAAAAFAYAVATRGSQTFLFGLGQVELTPETGLYVLAVASVASLVSLPVALLWRAVRSDSSSS